MKNIKPSGTFRFFKLMKERIAAGHDIIPLVAGELAEPTPTVIAEAGKQAIDDGYTKYTINQGLPELRMAICDKLYKENNLQFEIDNIIVSNGVKQALFNTLFALCDSGDEVIIIAPYYPSYPQMIEMSGGKVVVADNNTESIENAINEKTKAIIINSPNNPTGQVYDKDFLQEINELVKANDLWLISDEIYEKIVFDDAKHISPLQLDNELYDRTVIINGFSKSYAMTGWRIGYAAGPIELIAAAEKVQSHTTSNANSIAQMAAITALQKGNDFIATVIPSLLYKRNLAFDLLSTINDVKIIKPTASFYLWVDIESYLGKTIQGNLLSSADQIAEYLLFEHDVATVPGSAFGIDTHLRLSYSPELKQVEEGCRRIKKGLEQLN